MILPEPVKGKKNDDVGRCYTSCIGMGVCRTGQRFQARQVNISYFFRACQTAGSDPRDHPEIRCSRQAGREPGVGWRRFPFRSPPPQTVHMAGRGAPRNPHGAPPETSPASVRPSIDLPVGADRRLANTVRPTPGDLIQQPTDTRRLRDDPPGRAARGAGKRPGKSGGRWFADATRVRE